MSGEVKIGLIGAGAIGEAHILSFQQAPGAEVLAICDLNEARLKEMKEKYNIPASYTDYGEMLKEEQLDGVVIATPDHLHLAPVEAVAAAGLPMLLEKPIATTLEDSLAIMDAVDKAGVEATMGFCQRFSPRYIALKERVHSGVLGVPNTARAGRLIQISEAWRYNGRCSVNQYVFCHDMDYLLWVMGPEVESIYATRADSRVAEKVGEADSYLNLVRWKNGAMAEILITWAMPMEAPLVEDECLVIGSKGYAEVTRSREFRLATDDQLEAIEAMPEEEEPEYIDQAKAFINVVKGTEEPRSTLLDGLRAQKMTLAAEQSTRTGQPVKVEL
jgi:myo-inositol 2-dehydrogenase/D-chiro-inositol 1-dehydrogenase